MVGQEQRIHTGWLEVEGDRAVYAPHTRTGYRLPASKTLFTIGSIMATRAGIGKARERGLASPEALTASLSPQRSAGALRGFGSCRSRAALGMGAESPGRLSTSFRA